jgi:hypothetical protein
MRDEEKPPTTVEEAREANARFAKRIARRNLREIVAGGIVTTFFAFTAASDSNPTTRLGALLIALAAVPIVGTLLLRGRTAPPPPSDASFHDHVAHHRRELERQRDLLAAAWLWYGMPFVPGFVVLSWGFAHRHLAAAILNLVLIAPVLVGVGWLNRRGARKLDAQIAALPS